MWLKGQTCFKIAARTVENSELFAFLIFEEFLKYWTRKYKVTVLAI